MKLNFATVALAAGFLASGSAFAQAPAGAPAGSTGLCKDGSYTSNETEKRACADHKGVKDWFDGSAIGATPAKVAAPAVSATAPAGLAAKAVATPAKATTPALSIAPAAGGGPGQVWVNTGSKVDHCSGTKYYGKTKEGEYMTEAAAEAADNHADHGKASS